MHGNQSNPIPESTEFAALSPQLEGHFDCSFEALPPQLKDEVKDKFVGARLKLTKPAH